MLTTHDLPPTAAIVSTSQIDERIAHGVLDGREEQARAVARGQRETMADFLIEHRFLDPSERGNDDVMVEALHRYLLATNSAMAGVSLPDLVGQTESQNLPGTYREYPNWRVPLRDASGKIVWLEDLAGHPRFGRLIEVIRETSGG